MDGIAEFNTQLCEEEINEDAGAQPIRDGAVFALCALSIAKNCKTIDRFDSLILHIHVYFEAKGEMLPPAKAIFFTSK